MCLLRFFPEKAFEFSSPYLGTIKAAAGKASTYLAEIETIRQRVEGQRDTIDASFANAAGAQRAASNATAQVFLAREQLSKMETNAAFLELIARAFADDRDAFDQLAQISIGARELESGATNFRVRAWGVISSIVELHNVKDPNIPAGYFPPEMFLGNKVLKESEITVEEARLCFSVLPMGTKEPFLQWFSYSDRFTKLQKLEVLLTVRKEAKSLFLCERAVREFCRLTGSQELISLRPLHPVMPQRMEDWLRENRGKIRE